MDEGRLDGPAARGPGVCLVLAGRRLELTQETNASGRRRRLRPSPETATSGQSPHESNGYSTLDHLPSRVLTIVRREQPVFPQLDVKEVASPTELWGHGQRALVGGCRPPDEAARGRGPTDPARRPGLPQRARQ